MACCSALPVREACSSDRASCRGRSSGGVAAIARAGFACYLLLLAAFVGKSVTLNPVLMNRLASSMLDSPMPLELPWRLPAMATRHMVVASRTPDCIPSAASSADAPSAVIVDVARNQAVAVFASPDWLDSDEDAGVLVGMRRLVGDGIARKGPCWRRNKNLARKRRGTG